MITYDQNLEFFPSGFGIKSTLTTVQDSVITILEFVVN